MVAIFTGLGAGAERGSGNVLGAAGLLGGSSLGRSAEQVLLNAATGNLMIQQKDEMLVGLGPDASVARTYNSLGDLSDENGDNWRQSTDRRVYGLTGTVNTAGSTVKRVSADGSEITHNWDTTKSAYVAKDGSGAYDTLTWNSGTSAWTWTDGSSQLTETYGQASGSQWLITKQTDTAGNAVTFSYVSGTSHLDKVATADGSGTQYLQCSWSGNNITQITTSYTDLATNIRRRCHLDCHWDGAGRNSPRCRQWRSVPDEQMHSAGRARRRRDPVRGEAGAGGLPPPLPMAVIRSVGAPLPILVNPHAIHRGPQAPACRHNSSCWRPQPAPFAPASLPRGVQSPDRCCWQRD